MSNNPEPRKPPTASPTPAGGDPAAARVEVHHHHHHYHGGRRRAPRPVAEGGLPYEQVLAEAQSRRLVKAGLGASLVGLLFYAFARFLVGADQGFAIFFGLFAAAASGLSIFLNTGKLREADYRRVQGSRYADGTHRCIHCGNSGIWRQSPYQTLTVIAKCSKCGQYLWNESK